MRTPKDFWRAYHSLLSNRQRIPAILSDGSVTAECTSAKCDLLNCQLTKAFSNPDLNPVCCDSPTLNPPSPELSSIFCSNEEVLRLLSSIPRKTSSGPDGISSSMLQGIASAIASSLTTLFNRSLSLGQVPVDWKLSNITPVPKGGDPKLVSNYRPISLLSLPSKILERIVYNWLLSDLLSNSLLSDLQFGFRPCNSTQEALIAATTNWHQYLVKKLSVGAVFFDLKSL